MTYNLEKLRNTMLFNGMSDNEIYLAVQSLSAKEKTYKKNDTIMLSGTITDKLGLVIS